MALVGLLVGDDGAGLGLVDQVVGQLAGIPDAHLEGCGLGSLFGTDDADDVQLQTLICGLGHLVGAVTDVVVMAVGPLGILVRSRHQGELLVHGLGVFDGLGVDLDLLAAVELVHHVGVLAGGEDAQLVEAGDRHLVVLVQHQDHLILGLGPGAVHHLVVVGHHLADGGLGIGPRHDLAEDLRSLVLLGLAGQVGHLHGLDVAHVAVGVGRGHLAGGGAGVVLPAHGHLVRRDQLTVRVVPEDRELGGVGVLDAYGTHVLMDLALGIIQVFFEVCQIVLGDAAGQAGGPLDAGVVRLDGLEILVGLGLLLRFLGGVHYLVQVEGLLLNGDGVGGHGLPLHPVDVAVDPGGYRQDQGDADDADGPGEGGQGCPGLLGPKIVEAQRQ